MPYWRRKRWPEGYDPRPRSVRSNDDKIARGGMIAGGLILLFAVSFCTYLGL